MAKRKRERPAAESREIELKLRFAEADLPRLQRAISLLSDSEGRAETRLLRSVYFDTPELELRRAGVGLRVRETGTSRVQTVKLREEGRAALSERGEFECEIEGESPDLDAVPDARLRASLQARLEGKTLEPVVRTEIRRTRRRLQRAKTELFCDLDVGEITTARGSEPIFELELELVRGEPSALFEVALELTESVALHPSTWSKLGRGFALLTGERPASCKARRPEAARGATTEQVMEAAFDRCMEQILANEVPAHDGGDPEGVHQMRIGVRRFRSALALFAPLLPAEQIRPLSAELRWLGGELGPARDLDVFLMEVLQPLFRSRPDDPALKRLRDEANELRAESYERVRSAIDSPRYAALVLRLGAWRASRAWRDQRLSEESASLFAGARRKSRLLLEKRYRRARRVGRDLSRLSAEEKHALRIRLKRLRYAAEFLCTLHSAREAKPFLKRIASLQDLLGHLNDTATAERLLSTLLERMGSERSGAHDRAAGFVAGWTARESELRTRDLGEEWKLFRKARRFWRQ